MIGLDTNVLIRYLVEDEPEQARQAVALIEGTVDTEERLFVPHIVLCEVAWVLGSAYLRGSMSSVPSTTALAIPRPNRLHHFQPCHRMTHQKGRYDEDHI